MCGFTGTISLQQIDNKKIEAANKLIECEVLIVQVFSTEKSR